MNNNRILTPIDLISCHLHCMRRTELFRIFSSLSFFLFFFFLSYFLPFSLSLSRILAFSFSLPDTLLTERPFRCESRPKANKFQTHYDWNRTLFALYVPFSLIGFYHHLQFNRRVLTSFLAVRCQMAGSKCKRNRERKRKRNRTKCVSVWNVSDRIIWEATWIEISMLSLTAHWACHHIECIHQ